MKYILILMLSLYSVGATSQARVGFPIAKVSKEFPIERVNDSIYQWTTENAVVKYIVDEYNMVSNTLIYPLTQRDTKIFIAYYDKTMHKSSPSRWVFRVEGDSCYVTKVRKGDSDSVYFIWGYEEDITKFLQ